MLEEHQQSTMNYQPFFSTINRLSQLQILWAGNLMQNYLFPHEKLNAWQLAKELGRKIYDMTSAFPSREQFGLVDQVRRAGVSVCPIWRKVVVAQVFGIKLIFLKSHMAPSWK
jgi:hypothetical protein